MTGAGTIEGRHTVAEAADIVAASGAYPTRRPHTIEEVQQMLADGGFVEFRCDEMNVPGTGR